MLHFNMQKVGVSKKPSTIHLAKRLSYTNLLGMDATLKNGRYAFAIHLS
jgi:hypothetical protein